MNFNTESGEENRICSEKEQLPSRQIKNLSMEGSCYYDRC